MKKAIFLVSMLLLLMVGNLAYLNALGFDNVKETVFTKNPNAYTIGNKNLQWNELWEKYPNIKIENSFGLGKTLFEISLTEHTEICENDYCYSKGTFYTSGDEPVYTKMEFLTKQEDGSWVNQNVRSWSFNYWGSIDDYEVQCNPTGEVSINGTAIKECSNVKVGSHEDWIQLNVGEKLPEGTYDYFLEARKKPSRTIDWVMTSNGERLNEFAVWGAVIGVGGVEASVTLNSPADDSTQYANLITFNATGNVTGGAYLTNSSLNVSVNGGAWQIKNTTLLGYYIEGNEAHDVSFTGGEGSSSKDGLEIYIKQGMKITNIHKSNTSTATKCYLLNGTYSELTSGSYVGNDCAIEYIVETGKYYYAVADNNGGGYTRAYKSGGTTYPISRTYLDFTNGTRGTTESNQLDNIDRIYFNLSKSSSTETFTNTFNAGDVVDWNMKFCDSDGDCGQAVSDYRFTIDNSAPTISILYPSGLITTLAEGNPVNLNFTASDTNLDDCWYEYNGSNTTIPSCQNTTFNYVLGLNSITVWANDTVGNENSSTTSFEAKVIENSQTFSLSTVEGALEDFYANITVGTGIEISSAILHYSGDTQTASINSDGNVRVVFIEDYQIPDLPSTANVTFYWTLILSDSSELNLTFYNQSVSAVNLDNCGSYTNQLFNISLFNEELLTPINGTIELFYQVQNKPNYDTIQNFTGKFENVSNTLVCSDINLSGQNLAYSVEMRYYANYSNITYVTEFYHIQRQNIGDSQEISLYDLNSEDSTEFEVEYQDSNVEKIEGAIIQLQRKYIYENIYRVVEAPTTSTEGTAILHIDLNTVKYKVTVVKNGVVLDIFDNIVFSCDNELSGQCKQKLYAEINPDNEVAIENLRDFSYSLTSTNSTIDLTYSIPSGVPGTISVVMSQYDQFGNETLCNKTIISSAGSTSCTYNNTIGDSYITLTITKDGIPQAIKSYLIPESGAVDFLSNNFFIVLIFLLSITGMAFTSPEWIILNGVLVMLIAGSLYLLNGLNFVMGLGGLAWLIIAAGILIFKIAKQEDR